MANISLLSRLVNGVQRQVDLSANTLVVSDLQINGINLRSTAGSGASGSDAIGDDNSYANFTPSAATVKGALEGIDAALTGSGSTQQDGTFRIENTTDPTKKIAFDASAISASTVRTLKMADANVDLANLTNSNIAAAAGIVYSKLSLTNSILNADINSAAAIAYSKLDLTASIVNADIASAAAIAYNKLAALGGSTNAVLIQNGSGFVAPSAILSTNLFLADGSVSATANLNFGGFKGVNAADPTLSNDLTTKNYVDNLLAGLSWKQAVRAASTANVSVASAPSSIDGVTLAANDRVLLKNQTAPAENGIYVFAAAASPLVRSTDMDNWNEVVSSVMLVSEGSVNQGSKWVNTNIAGGTLGSTSITFVAFSVNGTVNGTGTTNYVAYWSGTSTLTAEQFLSASRGGLGADASAFTGVLKAVSGVFSASTIVNADINAAAGIVYSKLALTNSIVNADIATGAAIAYSKLALTNSIVANDLTANSVNENKIAASTLDSNGGLLGGGGTKLSVNVDGSSIEIDTNTVRIGSGAYDQDTIIGGGNDGSAVVGASPILRGYHFTSQVLNSGEVRAVRFMRAADSGFVAGHVTKADNDATSANNFWVIGIVCPVVTASINELVQITKAGPLSAPSHGFTIGEPIWLGTNGVLTSTAPTSTNLAAVKVGIALDTDTIDVQIQTMGVN